MNNIHDMPDPYMDIYAEAQKRGIQPVRVVIERGAYAPVGHQNLWHDPILASEVTEKRRELNLELVKSKGILTDLSWAISNTIQFPVNTVFAHALGVVASAMSKSFSFEYGYSEKPVNLYVVTAQPPSTGKSGVNEILTEPVHLAFETINKTAKSKRAQVKANIDKLKAEKKDQKTPEAWAVIEDDLIKLYEEMDKHTIYTYALDDATPEALSKIALNQKGLFNVISAEADAINVILGGVYSDKKANFGLFLKGWDAERHQVARASQETMSGVVVGNIAVIAQDESIKTILAAGESGRGISERFLLLREPTRLGTRDFDRTVDLDKEVTAKYSKLIYNLVREGKTVFKFSEKAKEDVREYRKALEPEMGDDGIYSNNLMRGFIGKADKQIFKIASVLHACNEWAEGGNRRTTVSNKTVNEAMHVFKEIVKGYISAADELGFTGASSEYLKIEERLCGYAEKGKVSVTINQLRGAVKNITPFNGTPALTEKLRDVILPTFELNRMIVLEKNRIYINPKLKG